MEIVRSLLPVLIVGGIGVFVVKRLEHKYRKGDLGRENRKVLNLLDSLIPLGMLFGCTTGIIFSMLLSTSLLSTISLGAGIGLLFGYFAYEISSKKGISHS